MTKYKIQAVLIISIFLSIHSFGKGSTNIDRRVAMRTIGHQLLLLNNDSLSRVLPIKDVNDTYSIEFSAPLGIIPDQLISVANKVNKKHKFAQDFYLEVIDLSTKLSVYETKIIANYKPEQIACKERPLPKGKYMLKVKIIKPSLSDKPHDSTNTNTKLGAWPALFLLILPIGYFLFKNKKGSTDVENERMSISINSDLIQIGAYYFNPILLTLKHNQEEIQLSSKESKLLEVLYEHKNATVTKDTLLTEVWNDAQNYVGRTLDVFISKLRKRLASDPNIKILNERGVGYKLIVPNL